MRIETLFPLMFDLTINMELIRVSFCCDVSFSGWGMHNVNEISHKDRRVCVFVLAKINYQNTHSISKMMTFFGK